MPASNFVAWSVDELALLKDLWGKPGISASTIADRLPGRRRTRSGVIGMAHRLGLPPLGGKVRWAGRPPRKVAVIEPKPKPMPKPAPMLTGKMPPSAWCPIPGSKPVALTDLTPDACRWPISYTMLGATVGYCGCQKKPGSPYCTTHDDIATREGFRYQGGAAA